MQAFVSLERSRLPSLNAASPVANMICTLKPVLRYVTPAKKINTDLRTTTFMYLDYKTILFV